MKVKLILGSLVSLAAIVGATLGTGYGISVAVVFRIVLPVIGLFLGSMLCGPGLGILADAMGPCDTLSPKRRESALGAIAFARRALLLIASLGLIMNLVSMFKSLEDRNAVWINLALAMGPALVALFIHAVVLEPLVIRLRRSSLKAASSSSETERPTNTRGRAGILIRQIPGFCLMLASLIALNPDLISGIFLHLPAILIAVFIPIGLLIAAGDGPSMWRSLGTVFSSSSSTEELKTAQELFGSLTLAFKRAMALGAALGFVFLVKDWLDITRYGPTLALALISLFWGMIGILFISLPLEALAAQRACREVRPC